MRMLPLWDVRKACSRGRWPRCKMVLNQLTFDLGPESMSGPLLAAGATGSSWILEFPRPLLCPSCGLLLVL